MELGLLDHTTFVNAFGPSRKAVAEGFMETWKRARKELSEGLPPAGTAITSAMRRQIKTGIDAFLKEMASENSRFLQVSLEAYTEELKKELRRTHANLLT